MLFDVQNIMQGRAPGDLLPVAIDRAGERFVVQVRLEAKSAGLLQLISTWPQCPLVPDDSNKRGLKMGFKKLVFFAFFCQ